MSPIKVVVTNTGSHLADAESETAWCGTDLRLRPSFEFDKEAAETFGESRLDCRRCLRELHNHQGLP